MPFTHEEQIRAGKVLQGAYVAAWVYVDLREGDDDEMISHADITDEKIMKMAKEQYHDAGTLELDDGVTFPCPHCEDPIPRVSRSEG